MRNLSLPRRWSLLGACAVFSLAVSSHGHAPRLIYNPSASAPKGWYTLSAARDLKVDDYVLADLPEVSKRLANERGYLPQTVPLLKRIGAIADQFVCVRGRALWIDGRLVATALTQDREGRKLIAWKGCRVLEADEFLLISSENSASFDSRYVGPIRMTNVIGKASPLWTW